MNKKSIAPCGLICDLCTGFQREINKCVGCNYPGNKAYHCNNCSIMYCNKKDGNEELLCYECPEYPCRRLKNLDKRYRTKYGESLVENFQIIEDKGTEEFLKLANQTWKCKNCGELLSVHRDQCQYCGEINNKFPSK